MKKFNLIISGTLSFKHDHKDYIITGAGPHELPSDNKLVQSLVAQGALIPCPTLKKQKLKN